MTNTTYWFLECHYRPSQGRWLSPDPAGMAAVDPSDPQTWNRYAYVRNSSLNKIDPQGLDGWDEGWGGGGDGCGWGDGGWGVNCTLSLLRSRVRKSPIADDYPNAGDDCFVEYSGAVQSIVTSSANSDSGMFETNLRDECFLPFEGAGAAESTWKLDLPKDYPAFDYATISDVILHIRYTARQGVDPTKVKAGLAEHVFSNGANLSLFFSLPHDFPTECRLHERW